MFIGGDQCFFICCRIESLLSIVWVVNKSLSLLSSFVPIHTFYLHILDIYLFIYLFSCFVYVIWTVFAKSIQFNSDHVWLFATIDQLHRPPIHHQLLRTLRKLMSADCVRQLCLVFSSFVPRHQGLSGKSALIGWPSVGYKLQLVLWTPGLIFRMDWWISAVQRGYRSLPLTFKSIRCCLAYLHSQLIHMTTGKDTNYD